MKNGQIRAVTNGVALVKQAECEFDFLVVHVENLRIEAGLDHGLPAHGVRSATEVGGEEWIVGVSQRKWMTPALDVVGMSVWLEDSQR
jgi:hypothetical protein